MIRPLVTYAYLVNGNKIIFKVIDSQLSFFLLCYQALDEAKEAIQQLFAKIIDIKEKADKSEQMVSIHTYITSPSSSSLLVNV